MIKWFFRIPVLIFAGLMYVVFYLPGVRIYLVWMAVVEELLKAGDWVCELPPFRDMKE